MDFDNIKVGLSRVRSLVEGWESAGVEELERDLALEELRRIYSEIRFGEGKAKEQPEAVAEAVVVPPVAAEEPAPEIDAEDEDVSDEPEIEVELIMPDEDEQDDEPEEDAAEDDAVEDREQPTADGTTEDVPAVGDAAQIIDTPIAEEPAAVQQPAEATDESDKAEEQKPVAAETEQPKAEPVGAEVVTTCDTTEIHDENRNSEQSLFGDDEIVLTRASRRRVIMSLYDDDMPIVVSDRKSVQEVKAEAAPAAEAVAEKGAEVPPTAETATETEAATGTDAAMPSATEERTERTDLTEQTEQAEQAEQTEQTAQTKSTEPTEPGAIPATVDEPVLGDVLRADIHTLGESIARPKGLAESAPVASLRAAIGINDRFLLIRDLFDGDAAAYERAIVAIDSFDNLDDCMVHIVENYSWRSSSDGAKLIMNLIQRKFRK